MSARPWWSRPDVIGAGVLLAAALGAWQAARVADALGFGPGAGAASTAARGRTAPPAAGPPSALSPEAQAAAPRPGSPPAASTGLPAAVEGLAGEGGGAVDVGPEPGTEAEAAARLAAEMRRFVEDLEYSPGLPEPRQQVVRPAPAAWRPPAGAEVGAPPEVAGLSPGRGPAGGGTQVLLRGRRLRVVQVMFGAAPGRIARAGPEEVLVVAPPGRAGPVRVAVTNADGTWAVVEEPFTYL